MAALQQQAGLSPAALSARRGRGLRLAVQADLSQYKGKCIASKSLQVGNMMGEGSFGQVYQVNHCWAKRTGTPGAGVRNGGLLHAGRLGLPNWGAESGAEARQDQSRGETKKVRQWG